MKLTPVPKRSGLDRLSFKKEFLEPMQPVVFTDLIDTWPAKEKWTFDFFIGKYGDIEVPVYDSSFSKGGKSYMASVGKMKFGEYLKKISEGPTELRIFLFNIFKRIPELREDIRKLDIMDGFLDDFPFMFFGEQGSFTKIHYDIVCAHVFLTQFQNKKRVLLFSQEQSKYLYHIPFTVACLVDPIDPDEKKYPSLKYIEGHETVLEHGETLFIPSQYWHHIEYTEGGYSIALRANESIQRRMKGVFNIARHMVVDRGLNYIMGDKWMDIKVQMANNRAHAK